MKIDQYPRNLDSTPLDLEVGVLTDSTGNGGARLTEDVVGPDGAPVDKKALILVEPTGVPVVFSNVFSVNTRAEMAALEGTKLERTIFLAEAGREGFFDFVNSNLSTLVAADTNQGIYVAPASAPTGASGAWVRKYDGEVWAHWFGTVGDNVANDGPRIASAIAVLKLLAVNDDVIYKTSNRLRIRAGMFYMGATVLDITHTLTIEGEGSGKAGGRATTLRWDANTDGFRIQRYNTSGDTTIDGVQHYAGDGVMLRGLHLRGGFVNMTATPEGDHHGVFAKARCVLEDIWCQLWQGEGFHIGAPSGNTNNVFMNRCTAWYCRAGCVFDGADANAGTIIDYDFSYNRTYGFREDSHLGNIWIGGHADSNGVIYADADNKPTLVSQGGNRYYVRMGQEAGASTNAPTGTTANNTWWGFHSVGGVAGNVIPAWFNGIQAREGGPYRVNGNPANQATILGIYTEGGQAFSKGYSNALTISGSQNTPVEGETVVNARARNGAFSIEAGTRFEVQGGASYFYPKLNDPNIVQFGKNGQVSAFDRNIKFYTDNTTFGFEFYSNNGGTQLDGWMFSLRGAGFYIDGRPNINLRAGGADIASVVTAGVNLAAGKVLQVTGTQVVGAQGAAVADVAAITSSDAPALTSVNATNAAAAPTQTEFNNFVAEFNKLRTDVEAIRTRFNQDRADYSAGRTTVNTILARIRAATGHGLIA